MDSPTPPPLQTTAGLWKAWTAIVVGTPLLGVVFLLIADKSRSGEALLPLVGLGAALSMAGHLVVSIMLSIRLAARREPPHRIGASIGLTVGLIFGGWAAMFAIFFCGCLAVMEMK